MSKQPEAKHRELWQAYAETWRLFHDARSRLFQECGKVPDTPIIEVLQWALCNNRQGKVPGCDPHAMFDAVRFLNLEAQFLLFDELFPYAVKADQARSFNEAEQILLMWPKDRLRREVHRKVKEIIHARPDQIDPELLGFVFRVDLDAAQNLAETAANSSDPRQKELGRHFLGRIKEERE
ncbi:MAG: hypothetical protein K1Y36_27890 [Blastocatellia bacterium]|nr:hypothetical protein [Blastocatellia bacterium]